jgi:hypothetical protein
VPTLPKIGIEKCLIEFVGKQNLSMESAVSKPLRSLILTSISVGQENPGVTPESLFPEMSRRALTAHFIDEGRKLYDFHLARYRSVHFIALAIDAGKLGHNNYLDILITNSYLDAPPLIFKAISNFKGDINGYRDEIKNAITEVETDGFAVAGIVSDNLRVQIKAITEVQEENANSFLHIPCGCHCLALGIKDFCSQNPRIEQAVHSIELF